MDEISNTANNALAEQPESVPILSIPREIAQHDRSN